MNKYPFKLEALPYSYSALEPFIDQETMTIHHTKHHQAYVNNLNNALEKHPELHNLTLEELLTRLDNLPKSIQLAVRNNGGGVYNHNLFWKSMTPDSSLPSDSFINKINDTFGSLENFKSEFKKAALGRFGSGWAWLVSDKDKKLMIISTPNQDTPLEQGLVPLLPLDVWEHAYYLKYQNRRNDYIDNWFEIINWPAIENRYH